MAFSTRLSPGHVPKRENVADLSVGAVTQCDVLQIVTLLATADRRGDRSAVEVGEPRLVSAPGVEKHRRCPANDRRCVDYLPCHGVRIDDPTVGVEHEQSVTGLLENVPAGDRCPHEQVEAKEGYPDEPLREDETERCRVESRKRTPREPQRVGHVDIGTVAPVISRAACVRYTVGFRANT